MGLGNEVPHIVDQVFGTVEYITNNKYSHIRSLTIYGNRSFDLSHYVAHVKGDSEFLLVLNWCSSKAEPEGEEVWYQCGLFCEFQRDRKRERCGEGGERGGEGERGRKEVEREERRRQKDGRREYRACIADTKKCWKTVISNSVGYSSI